MKDIVYCGDVKIGGDSPVSIQSMTNTKTADVKASLEQIYQLQDAGCEIIRLAVPDKEAAYALKEIKAKTKIPVVADIHFDPQLAIEAIKSGVDKIRINPGNIGPREGVKEIARLAKERDIPIRVGVNSGSLEKDILEKHGCVNAEGLAESALRNVEILHEFNFDNIVISLKSSDVQMNYDAYNIVHRRSNHPLHIGVTEAGTPSRGKVKSAAGIGGLLLAGIGDTMRVSLTANPVEEVIFAKELLESIGLRKSKVEIVSCPTCGRTQVDLERIASAIEQEVAKLDQTNMKPVKLAVMGCAVNGPGEARGADFGVACGKGKGVIFAKGEIIGSVPEENIASEILRLVRGI